MTEDTAAAVFHVPTMRVTLAELERIKAEDAARASARSSSSQAIGFSPATALPTVECSAPAFPQGPCPVCPRLAVEFEPWRQAGYWKSLHERAKERERGLQQENQQLQARIRYLEKQLYGKKTESSAATAAAVTSSTPTAQAGPPGTPPQAGPATWRPWTAATRLLAFTRQGRVLRLARE